MKLAIEIKNLYKKYNKNFLALNNINLNIMQGDFFSLLGPNGAGKTTLISILTNLLKNDNGTIKIFGKNINCSESKKIIGLVPQEINLNIFETAEQIVITQAGYYGISRKIAKERSDFYFNKLNLWNKKNIPPRFLSGGTKRRVMIIRALLHNPKILILDEPTAGVDIESRMRMWNFLKKLNENKTTIILTTHYLEEAEKLCNKIAIINNGKIIKDDSMKNILSSLNEENFLFYLKNKIKKIPRLNFVKISQINEKIIDIVINKENITFNEVINHLTKHGISVINIKNRFNKLENLFVNLINKKIS